MRMVVTAPSTKVYDKTLRAGDRFDVPDKEGRLYAALGRAREASGDPAATVEATAAPDEITALRADYKTKTGRDADQRWGAGRLKHELRQGGTYGRRDMRAEG